MPRIPTSKPDRAPRRPSVGGQVDIRSQDAFFRSIAAASAEAGVAFERLQLENQRIADADALNKQKIHQISEATKLKEDIIRTPVDQHDDLINKWIDANRSFDLGKDASKEAKIQSENEQSLFVQQSISNVKISSTQRRESEARQNAASLEGLAIEELNSDKAIGAWVGILSQDQIDARKQVITKAIENKKKALKKESDTAIANELLTKVDSLAIENNLNEIDQEIAAIDNGEGLSASMTEVKRLSVRNSMVEQRNAILHRRSVAFGSVLDDAIKNGSLNDQIISDMIDNNLLTPEQEVEMRKVFSSESRTKQLTDEFSEQKTGISYKTIDKELDEKYLLSFAEGDNTKILEEDIREFVDRIDRDPALGIIAKNKLKSKLTLAASQAVIESDNALGTQLGETWEDLPDERKAVLSRYAEEVSKIMLESNAAQLSLTQRGDDTQYPSFADVLIEDLRFLANEFNRGVDPSKTRMPELLRFYRVGSQQARIRNILLSPVDIAE